MAMHDVNNLYQQIRFHPAHHSPIFSKRFLASCLALLMMNTRGTVGTLGDFSNFVCYNFL
jgi:hypothetical protein